MTKGFFISPIVFLLAGMGLALAQNPDRTAPPTAQPASLSPAADKPALPHDAFNGCPRDCGPGRLWVSGEYLLWWTKGASVPSLLITGPAPAQSGFGATTAPIPTAPGFIGLQT